MEHRTDTALLNRRSPAVLSLTFGMVALFLSAIGTMKSKRLQV